MSDMRTLGNTDMKAVPVGLGCMGFSHAYGAPTQKQEAVRMIRAAYEMGYNFFDTAECYIGTNADGSTSYNEELVGEALADVRDKVVIATKFGVQHSPTGLQMDSRPETIRRSVEGSLKKLGTDHIDLYYQHRIDPKIGPETVAEVMAELMKLLEDKAAEKNATKGQVSLAWMLCKKPYIIPIPGSRKEARIRENLGAKDVILTAEEICRMDELLDRLQMPVYGQRAGRN